MKKSITFLLLAAMTAVTAPATAYEQETYTGNYEQEVFYEDLLVVDIEKIYSSYCQCSVYHMTLYDYSTYETTYLNVTPEYYTYNWVHRVYLEHFHLQGHVDIESYEPVVTYHNNLDFVVTTPQVRYRFNPLVYNVNPRTYKKKAKVFRKTSKRVTKKHKYAHRHYKKPSRKHRVRTIRNSSKVRYVHKSKKSSKKKSSKKRHHKRQR